MTETAVDAVIEEYLRQLDKALGPLPDPRRAQLVAEIADHVATARDELDHPREADIRNLLDRIGRPEDIAAEAIDSEPPATTPRSTGLQESFAIAMLLVGGFFFVVGWFVGLVLLWTSSVWRLRDKLIGTVLLPGGLFPAFVLTFGAGSSTIAHGNALSHAGSISVFAAVIIIPIITAIYLNRRRRPSLSGPEASEVRRVRARRRPRYDASRLVKFLGGVALVGAAAAAIAAAGSVRTDGDVLVVVPFAAIVTILVVSVALGPALRAVLAAGCWIPGLRPVLAAAARHRTPAVVRVALAAAMVVALTAVVLGASVGGRTPRLRAAVAELQRVSVLPPGVMAVTTGHTPDGETGVVAGTPGLDAAPGPAAAISSESVAAIRRRYPDAEVIPVASVRFLLFFPPSPWLLCLFDARCALPVIVADPRLVSVYGQTARPSDLQLSVVFPSDSSGTSSTRTRSAPTVQSSLSAPGTEDLVGRRAKGGPLPAATFQGLVALEVGPDVVAKFGLSTQVTTVFVTRHRPFTAKERSALRSLVPTATAITADDRSASLRNPLGKVPWAPTATATQWSIATIGALFALLVVMSTGIVEARNRRRNHSRLQLLGATPHQARGAAALHAGLVLAVGAVLAAAAVTELVAFGVARFSAHQPAIAVPFVFPLPQIAFLVVGVPLLGALIAAANTPPGSPTRRPANATTSR